MKVVIDTNVLIAGLLKDSIVRQILFFNHVDFYLPDKAIEELKKHKSDLLEKSDLSSEEFGFVIDTLLEKMTIVSKEVIKPFMEKSEEIMKGIDVADSAFIATALSIGADGIWSFDNHFKEQKEVSIISVEDLMKTLDEVRG